MSYRIDRVLGFEQHFIRGTAKMEARITLALVVLLAMALGRIRAKQPELMRSLTAPVRRAARNSPRETPWGGTIHPTPKMASASVEIGHLGGEMNLIPHPR